MPHPVRCEIRNIGNALFLVDDQVEDDIEIFSARLLDEVRGRVSVGAAVIHVHVHVAANPVCPFFGEIEGRYAQRQCIVAARRNVDQAALYFVFESAPDGDVRCACGQLNGGGTVGVKILGLEFAVVAIVGVVRMHAGVQRCVARPSLADDRHPCGTGLP